MNCALCVCGGFVCSSVFFPVINVCVRLMIYCEMVYGLCVLCAVVVFVCVCVCLFVRLCVLCVNSSVMLYGMWLVSIVFCVCWCLCALVLCVFCFFVCMCSCVLY